MKQNFLSSLLFPLYFNLLLLFLAVKFLYSLLFRVVCVYTQFCSPFLPIYFFEESLVRKAKILFLLIFHAKRYYLLYFIYLLRKTFLLFCLYFLHFYCLWIFKQLISNCRLSKLIKCWTMMFHAQAFYNVYSLY